jgi:threonine dehydratase
MSLTVSHMPDRAGVLRAAAKVAAILPPTPLLPLEVDGRTIWCKAECLQPVGAFKIRGAWHRLTELTEAEHAKGVVGVSSGNHAQGVAWAAKRLGIAATIVMPVDAPQVKLDATRALGADVMLYDRPGGENRDQVAAELILETGATLVHAFADPWVIEGQGSVGIEIDAQMHAIDGDGPDVIVCPCGGGGLSAGLALACPDATIVPVEPVGWDTVGRSLAAGELVPIGPDAPPTPCDSLQPAVTHALNLELLHGRIPYVATVTPAEVRAAQRLAFSKLRLVVEPGGAAALAAVLAGKVELGASSVVVLSGGNTDPAAYAQVLSTVD